ncbi:hypothetical protein V8C86DRAFT_1707975 [Haematococcus lacustris]
MTIPAAVWASAPAVALSAVTPAPKAAVTSAAQSFVHPSPSPSGLLTRVLRLLRRQRQRRSGWRAPGSRSLHGPPWLPTCCMCGRRCSSPPMPDCLGYQGGLGWACSASRRPAAKEVCKVWLVRLALILGLEAARVRMSVMILPLSCRYWP